MEPVIPADPPIPWTEEARRRVENAPAFVRRGILKLMQKRARERGRTVIDSAFLTEIRNEAMLRVARCIKGFGFEELSMDAFEVAKAKMRKLPRKVEVIEAIKAFLAGRTQKNEMILDKFQRYLDMMPDRGLPWTEEALARLQRAPGFVRELARQAIEAEARRWGEKVVTPEVVDLTLGAARAGVGASPERTGARADEPLQDVTMLWTAEAEGRLRRIPIPAIRRMVIRRVEARARERECQVVDVALYDEAVRKPAVG
ncbi:MAG: PCP reductase family protein [Candidatus Rokubacteria bacterium]|nr:PCP reductase family protein [Candidatus Rokubacteria bacterium]